MPVFILALFVLILFALPLWMRNYYRRAALSSTNDQVWLLLGFYGCLICTIFLAAFSVWVSLQVTLDYVAPYLTGERSDAFFWDAPLTPRGFLFMFFLIVVPWTLLSRVGLLAIRDSHQVCKEQLDRVRKRHDLGVFWKGF